MSLIVAANQIIGDASLYQPWDPTRTSNPGAVSQDNQGCAPGWATIYVQDSLTGNTVKVCRRLDEAILGPGGAAIIAEESGPDWYDESIMNVAEVSEQIVQGGGAVLNALSPALTSTALAIGALALLLFVWKK
jgi:hypothetical protein